MANWLKKILYDQYQCLQVFLDHSKVYLVSSTKSSFWRWLEIETWLLREGEFCSMYYAWGLNARETEPGDFVSRREFLRWKNLAEKRLARWQGLGALQYAVLTKDKFVCNSYLQANGIPCPRFFGFIRDGQFYPTASKVKDLEQLLQQQVELFFKNVIQEAGDGVIYGKYAGGKVLLDGKPIVSGRLESVLTDGIWLVQSRIQSSAAIREINSSALNTTRILTIIRQGKPQYLAGFQSFATAGATTDSWGKGSLIVGIDLERECLLEQGYYNLSDPRGSCTKRHPDSGVVFRDHPLPGLQLAVDMCLRAHEILYTSFIIGWDVALTEEGPCIVEANERPGMNVVQATNGGLRKQIREAWRELMKTTKDKR